MNTREHIVLRIDTIRWWLERAALQRTARTLPLASDVMEQRIKRPVRITVNPAAHLGPIEQPRHYMSAIGDFADKAFSSTAPTTTQ